MQREADIKKLQDRMSEHEVRIGQLNLEKCNQIDISKQLELKIKEQEKEVMKRDSWIAHLQGDILLLKEDSQGKDEIIQSMQKTIMKKGKTNQRLSEVVNTFKN